METRNSVLKGFAAAITIALLVAGCTNAPIPGLSPSPPQHAGSTLGEPDVVATGLEAPWSVAFNGDTPLISERDSGRILALGGDGQARQVAKIAGVSGVGEGGLLGIATHDRYLYAYFTAGDENRIERYPLTGSETRLSLGPAEMILGGIPSGPIHNGGRIAFGPDGMLYVTTGDAGARSHAQDLDSLAGKILRLSPDGKVPEDNPFDGSPVYSYGHRNSQGLAWADDGTLYASEFGQNTWDELNVIEPGGNYGWPEVEGIANNDDYIDPVQQWEPAEASPSGMAISGGNIYLANLRGQRLREVPLSATDTSTEYYVGDYGRLRDAVITPDGALWILTNNTDGRGKPRPDDDRVLSVELG